MKQAGFFTEQQGILLMQQMYLNLMMFSTIFRHNTHKISGSKHAKSEMRNSMLIYSEFTLKMENIIGYMLNQKAGDWTNSRIKMDAEKSFAIIAIKHSVPNEYWKTFGNRDVWLWMVKSSLYQRKDEKGSSLEIVPICHLSRFWMLDHEKRAEQRLERFLQEHKLMFKAVNSIDKLWLQTSTKERTVWTSFLKP